MQHRQELSEKGGLASTMHASGDAIKPQAVSKGREILADLMVGLGAAHVAYIGRWSHLLTLGPSDLFWMKSSPAAIQSASLIVSTAILGVVVCLLIRATRGRRAIAAAGRGLLWAVAAVTINSVRACLAGYNHDLFGGNLLRHFTVAELGLALVAAAALFLLVVKSYRTSFVSIIRHALIAMSLLGFFNVGRAVYQVRGRAQSTPLAPVQASFLPTHPGTSPRVVWLVFDELDYRLLFADRKQGISLPVLDDFRQSAIFASHAYPPSSATSTSMLTYLLGEKVEAARPHGMDDLILRIAEHPARERWKQLPNIFSQAREAGVNGAVVGWYVPYSRLLASVTVDSWWFDNCTVDGAIGNRLPEMLLKEPRTLIETSLLSPFGQSLLTEHRVSMFHQFMAKTHQLLSDDRVGLLLLHVPVPHTPYFYDRQTGQESLANSMISGYWDALALVDRVVGELRTQMRQSGEWDNSVVLISSDHYYRTAMRMDGRMDHRVPFLLKMPGQRRAFSFEKSFNTQLSHNLVLDILRGQVRTDGEAMNWLEESHSKIPVGSGVR